MENTEELSPYQLPGALVVLRLLRMAARTYQSEVTEAVDGRLAALNALVTEMDTACGHAQHPLHSAADEDARAFLHLFNLQSVREQLESQGLRGVLQDALLTNHATRSRQITELHYRGLCRAHARGDSDGLRRIPAKTSSDT